MAKNKASILIVDDEPDLRELLAITITRMGLDVDTVEDLTSAQDILQQKSFQLCLTDMQLPDGNGLDVIQFIQEHCPQTPVAMITAYGNTETAIAALKAGAFDYVNKPVEIERLRQLITNAINLDTESAASHYADPVQLIGNSPSIEQLRNKIGKLARSQAPVYISGESGSGKEVVARLIHAKGSRSNGPFVPVNCGAIPAELMESEFFGHVKGSFTGAIDHKTGLFEAANGGTLFLDEVADLPLPMQVKLLRAIQEKAIRKVGSNEELAIDVRILSATHKDLNLQVEKEYFRSDLFYRINVIELQVPPLRQRAEDIPLLADYALDTLSREWQVAKPKISEEALQALATYPFPGNVRELENILERAYTLCEAETIQIKDLQLNRSLEPATEKTTTKKTTASAAFGDLEGYLAEIEKEALTAALEQTRWNKTAAADLLGISFRQLRYKLKKLELDD